MMMTTMMMVMVLVLVLEHLAIGPVGIRSHCRIAAEPHMVPYQQQAIQNRRIQLLPPVT